MESLTGQAESKPLIVTVYKPFFVFMLDLLVCSGVDALNEVLKAQTGQTLDLKKNLRKSKKDYRSKLDYRTKTGL